jgi:hypothetical protein
VHGTAASSAWHLTQRSGDGAQHPAVRFAPRGDVGKESGLAVLRVKPPGDGSTDTISPAAREGRTIVTHCSDQSRQVDRIGTHDAVIASQQPRFPSRGDRGEET